MKITLPLKKVLVFASVLMTAFAGAMFTEAKAQAIDEIVVTSQKRAAGISVQDIPTSVTAVNAELIEATDSVDLTDVGRLAPMLHFTHQLHLLQHPILLLGVLV